MDLDLVVVYRAKTELMANSIRDLLAQDKIASVLTPFRIMNAPGQSRTNVYGNNFGAWGEVSVERSQADQAVELIQGFLAASATPLSDVELEALALAADNPEQEPKSMAAWVEDDRKRSPLAAWFNKAHRLFWILVAAPFQSDESP